MDKQNLPVEASQNIVLFGVQSDQISECSSEHLWAALEQTVRAPGNILSVQDVKFRETGGGFTCREYTISDSAGNRSEKVCHEHVYCDREKMEVRAVELDQAGTWESDEENVYAICTEPLRLEFFRRRLSTQERIESTMDRSTALGGMNRIVAIAKVLQRSYGH